MTWVPPPGGDPPTTPMDAGPTGPQPPMSTPIDFGDGRPLGCRHPSGGAFAHEACTIEWQCCNGMFVHGNVGCGAPCLCLEETGVTGCLTNNLPPPIDGGPITVPDAGPVADTSPTPTDTTPPPADTSTTPPPAGATCRHTTQGGTYGHTACSESYQCCDGTWRLRTSGCGTCSCVEPTGASGCGVGTTPPPTDSGPPTGGMYPHGPSNIASSPNWSCDGLAGDTWNPTGSYWTTSFGCWVDSNGGRHQDSGDNCIPACSLSSIGCSGVSSGPECEYMLNWYIANTDRFGCGTKLRVTAPENGKQAIVVAIDRGPNCRIEQRVNYWVLDMSTAVSMYLFGEQTSATERREVIVEVVPDSFTLGPVN